MLHFLGQVATPIIIMVCEQITAVRLDRCCALSAPLSTFLEPGQVRSIPTFQHRERKFPRVGCIVSSRLDHDDRVDSLLKIPPKLTMNLKSILNIEAAKVMDEGD